MHKIVHTHLAIGLVTLFSAVLCFVILLHIRFFVLERAPVVYEYVRLPREAGRVFSAPTGTQNDAYIAGGFSYPSSSVIPENFKVCAVDAASKNEYCTEKRIPLIDGNAGYEIGVPAGAYYVRVSGLYNLYGYYAHSASCKIFSCLRTVTVESGETVVGINPSA